MPHDIISDRGSIFTSEFWKKATREWHIQRKLSTAFHPQTDGQTERTNAIMEQYLRAYVNYQQDDWTEKLPMAEFAYNNAKQETINESPFYANYGYHPDHESLRKTEGSGDQEKSTEEKSHTEELRKLHESLAQEMSHAQLRQKEYADRQRKPDPNIQIGEKVWLLPRNIRTTRPSRKLDYKKLGPYKVLAKVGKNAYKLDLPPSLKIHPTFHINLLEIYQDNPFPTQDKSPPPPIETKGDPEYELEEVIDSRLHHGKLQYRAKWTGYSREHDQEWYPADNFTNANEARRQFHAKYPDKPRDTETSVPKMGHLKDKGHRKTKRRRRR